MTKKEHLEQLVWHQHSNRLMVAILNTWNKEDIVYDLGAGHNFYVNVLAEHGYKSQGFDIMEYPSYNFQQEDITKPLDLYEDANILSLEVGEHIKEHEGYLDNLAKGKNILMSWAEIGQQGIGHINCRSNEWVISEMEKRGCKFNQQMTDYFRESVKDCHCSWFRKTLMYFTNE